MDVTHPYDIYDGVSWDNSSVNAPFNTTIQTQLTLLKDGVAVSQQVLAQLYLSGNVDGVGIYTAGALSTWNPFPNILTRIQPATTLSFFNTIETEPDGSYNAPCTIHVGHVTPDTVYLVMLDRAGKVHVSPAINI